MQEKENTEKKKFKEMEAEEQIQLLRTALFKAMCDISSLSAKLAAMDYNFNRRLDTVEDFCNKIDLIEIGSPEDLMELFGEDEEDCEEDYEDEDDN